MIKLLERLKQERQEAVRKIGINPGDYINTVSWFGDIWAQVESVYDNDSSYGWVVYYDSKVHCGTRMISFDDVSKIHRKNDPWDYREVRRVELPDGYRGDGKPPVALPDEFRYQGTFSIRPWLWNYCGRNVDPKQKKQLQKWLDLCGLTDKGIAWNEVQSLIKKLETRIKGWYPICEAVPEQIFDKSITVKD